MVPNAEKVLEDLMKNDPDCPVKIYSYKHSPMATLAFFTLS